MHVNVMHAQTKLLHLLIGVTPFDPWQEGRVLSSEVEMTGTASWPCGGRNWCES
jgi:hypothetical protein